MRRCGRSTRLTRTPGFGALPPLRGQTTFRQDCTTAVISLPGAAVPAGLCKRDAASSPRVRKPAHAAVMRPERRTAGWGREPPSEPGTHLMTKES